MTDAEIWSQIATVASIIAFLVLLVGVVTRRFVTPYLQAVLTEARGARQESRNVNDEVRPNDGASMKDALARIEETQNRMCRHVSNLDDRTARTAERVASIEGKQQIVLQIVTRGNPPP